MSSRWLDARDIIPLLTHWSYIPFAPSHQSVKCHPFLSSCCPCVDDFLSCLLRLLVSCIVTISSTSRSSVSRRSWASCAVWHWGVWWAPVRPQSRGCQWGRHSRSSDNNNWRDSSNRCWWHSCNSRRWEDTTLVVISKFYVHIFVIFKLVKDRYLEQFLWNCPQVNATITPWWLVNLVQVIAQGALRPLGVDKVQWSHMRACYVSSVRSNLIYLLLCA